MLHVSGQLKAPEMATGVELVDYGLLCAARPPQCTKSPTIVETSIGTL